MYYRIQQPFALRGWKNALGMLVKRPENEIKALKQVEFSVLMLCDGETQVDIDQLRHEERDIMQRLIKAGIVIPNETPLPVDRWQRYTIYENRFVQSVMWSVTGACNFRCRHCFVDGPEKRGHGFSTEEALSLVDQMAECGVMKVEITGGEPLIRPDFDLILNRLQERGIYLAQIYTNGYLVDEAFLDGLLARGMKPVLCFSFDGVNGWHSWMRGIEDAEEKTIAAMKLAVEKNFDVYASMCLHKGNLDSLPDAVRLLAGMGVKGLNISGITNSPLWEKNQGGYDLDDGEYLQAAMDYLPRYFKDGRPMNITFNGAYILQKEGECRAIHNECLHGGNTAERYLCPTTRFAPYISETGRLLPCMPMAMCEEQSLFPSVLKDGLKKCLTDSFFMDYVSLRVSDLFEANQTCRECELREACGGGCRANALVENHDLMGYDPYRCLIWKKGFAEILKKALDETLSREQWRAENG